MINQIEITPSQLNEALKAASDFRNTIVANISYAAQISGEDNTQYREQLKKADDTCNLLMQKMASYKVCP